MSNNLASAEDGVKPDASGKVRHTIIWDAEVWERIRSALRRLEDETHIELKVPDYIRGAVLKRNEEVLDIDPARRADDRRSA